MVIPIKRRAVPARVFSRSIWRVKSLCPSFSLMYEKLYVALSSLSEQGNEGVYKLVLEVGVEGLDDPLLVRVRESEVIDPGTGVGVKVARKGVLVFAQGENGIPEKVAESAP